MSSHSQTPKTNYFRTRTARNGDAPADAEPVEDQHAVIMANIALNFVMKWTYSSEPIRVTVLPKE